MDNYNYQIITGDSPYTLEKKVNELVLKGYNPIGGVCLNPDSFSASRYMQSVIKNNIKYEDEKSSVD